MSAKERVRPGAPIEMIVAEAACSASAPAPPRSVSCRRGCHRRRRRPAYRRRYARRDCRHRRRHGARRAVLAVQGVVRAAERVRPRSAPDLVVARAGRDGIIAVATADHVGAIGARDRLAIGFAVDDADAPACIALRRGAVRRDHARQELLDSLPARVERCRQRGPERPPRRRRPYPGAGLPRPCPRHRSRHRGLQRRTCRPPPPQADPRDPTSLTPMQPVSKIVTRRGGAATLTRAVGYAVRDAAAPRFAIRAAVTAGAACRPGRASVRASRAPARAHRDCPSGRR